MSKLLSIMRYLIPYWVSVVIVVISNLLVAFFSVISLTMVIPFLGLLFSSQDFAQQVMPLEFSIEFVRNNFSYYLGQIFIEYGKLNALVFIIAIVFVFTVLKNIFIYIGKTILIKIRLDVVRDVRNEIMSKILEFDLAYFSSERKGDIISKMINDVKEIELSIISSLEIFFKEPILLIVYMSVLFIINVKLTLIVLMVFPFAAVLTWYIGKKLKKKTFRGQQKMGLLVDDIQETLSGIKIVKALNAECFVEKRFNDKNSSFNKKFKQAWQQRMLANPVNDIISTVSILLIMWFGGKMVFNYESGFTSQEFIGYLVLFTQVINPAKAFSNAYYNINRGMASVDRVNTLLAHKYSIQEDQNPISITGFNKSVEFNHVDFAYSAAKGLNLKNVSFKVEKGQTVAIVGYSGAGKSTIVDLLPRFFDPQKGEVLIDEISLKRYKIKELRALFAYVTQEPVLFNDTIYNNIVFGRENVNPDDVIRVSKLAYAHDFITAKPNSYQTNIGDSGNKLSQGEKQRIAIARSLLTNPSILILDEATSALDYKSEQIVQKALGNLMKGRTTIIIAHRLSTIRNVDNIIVIENGELVEQGTHKELIENNTYYSSLYQFQN